MTAVIKRKMPLTFHPKYSCCAYRWAQYINAQNDLRKWARQLAKNIPRGGRPSEKQQKVLDELKGHMASAAESFHTHLDKPDEEHK
jgi:hypothetical protein